MGECKDVIDYYFYNIFELWVFWDFIEPDVLLGSQFAISKCSYDIRLELFFIFEDGQFKPLGTLSDENELQEDLKNLG